MKFYTRIPSQKPHDSPLGGRFLREKINAKDRKYVRETWRQYDRKGFVRYTGPRLQPVCLPGGLQKSKTGKNLAQYPSQLTQPSGPADLRPTSPDPKLHPSSSLLPTWTRSEARYPPTCYSLFASLVVHSNQIQRAQLTLDQPALQSSTFVLVHFPLGSDQ
jgi:hypothetical protein